MGNNNGKFKYGGYKGKILRVNLSSSKISTEPLKEDWAKDFLGGVGLAARFLYEELKPKTDPFSPENKLVLMTGPVQGTIVPTASRSTFCTKSPLTNNFFNSIHGGHIGAELKYAGYDGLIVEGKAEKPVYIWIDDDKVEIKDASKIWGKHTFTAHSMIRQELGDEEVHIATIGPAGEKGLRYALILCDMRASGRGGVGAVMGSKNLKAIAFRGTGEVAVPDTERIAQYALKMNEIFISNPATGKQLAHYGSPGSILPFNKLGILGTRNWQTEVFEGAEGICGETMREKVVKRDKACIACPIHCTKFSVVKDGPYKATIEGPDYEAVWGMGSMCGVDNLDAIVKGDEICDEYGFDLMSGSCTVAWAMEAFEKGIITKEDTGGIDLRFGNADAMLEMLEKIGKREEGLGWLLGEGSKRASEKIGKGSEEFCITNKRVEIAGHTARGLPGHAMGYAVGHRGGSHHDSRPTGERMGIVPRETTEGKGPYVAGVNHWLIFCDSLVLCHFGESVWGPIALNENTVEALNVVTGRNLTVDDANEHADRIWNLIRGFAAREGFTRDDDTLPKRFTHEPIPEGPSKGMVVTPEMLEKMKDEYFEFRGWDKKTGNPTKEKLLELDLDFIAKDLYPG
jgi:aldehyde:ferredoxin oxidoreductase